ncbi:Domain of uncharacterised function (DUF2935) [Clostridioides difficile]|uniref:DUF2935 domain-containing protein n=4 Tax=Clostridioides difficile TaxID=1496 RepID=A0A9R0BJU5_CLODR|nr:DUF2935 domain-containing protein [Clostridioides difficile]OFU02142.1 hypothetical protein HMPREF3085_09010 [Clostridium sp. HMSC19E03]OFU12320.1 hypothetical protein HMPREF3079_17070 [Clostridium sp. HMSC19C09]OFU17684.1 hypothetical protein HMPREF3077_16705 [Clostridium sp. HMSC19C05]OFU22466.1 hypothetical protein HMPREF3078_03325 [Clostridium sp. HMSC19C08]OFU28867.1 hypothetical protein HMPREF3074_15335 [Clostridium sp. HMSC19B10]OFU45011.1 hypothetical protein HMPREF3072_04505 [Clos
MIDNQKYVILSLELHLFFSRIMKEHALFLEAGFTNKNYNLAMEADHYKKQFEDLLSYTVSASNGIIRPDILYSEELVTTLTSVAEQKTEEFTGIEINKDITTRELNLQSGVNPQVGQDLVNYVAQLNSDAIRLLDGLINFKERVLDGVLSCTIFTSNYPLLLEHIIHEANLYRSYVVDLENKIDIESKNAKEIELFWDHIMMEHALFMRGLLDPSEGELINTSNDFAIKFNELIEKTNEMTDSNIKNITEETLNETVEFKDFKEAGASGIEQCKIKSIILPLLADHVLREANHYIRILESYKNM